ncbi:MAG TPA: RICIN domain-containing protein, partial [Bacteroidales bacterium]|nr:RICIN domain-containing protein [Bacteroidales bacterium]
MKKAILPVIIFLISGFIIIPLNAQTTNTADRIASAGDNLAAQPVPDRTVFYNVSDTGISKPLTWGLDLAWLDATNIRRGVAFMGADRVDVVRSSFMPTSPLVGDSALQGDALTNTSKRIAIINNYLGPTTKVVLNCDHPSVDPYFLENASHWAKLIEVTAKMHEESGRTVVSVSPFNEPDYGWGQYTGQNGKSDFYDICGMLRSNPDFDSIRISGGNTLNCDEALPWYNYLKDRLDEGNTHQLAGSFDSFANFFQVVRANGDHATDDELHNVMEAMVGAEYGMQTGIWWGTAELARGEFVKASDGKRLGYAEDRSNWTAASVYRNPQGIVKAFGGTSERQAITTTYRFVSKDRPVYYDGNGPQYEYTMEMPGGTGYQQGQTNAERVVNITWGDDIQPVINGKYILVNRNSGLVMEVANGSTTAGANIRQGTNKGATYQQWNVTPVSSRIGGDFSYFTFTAVNSGKSPDVYNWSLENNGNIALWDNTKGANQQWYLEYAGDGWFYIRSRFSARCLQVANASTVDGANIEQYEKNDNTNQQWRFIPAGTPVEFQAPSAPKNFVAAPNAESVLLNWSANPENDVAGYTILRSDKTGGSYNTIARKMTSDSFLDNTATAGKQYFYVVRAVDNSLNRSAYSNEASATATGDKELVTYLQFDGNTLDSTINQNNAAAYGDTTFVAGKVGDEAVSLNGKNEFIQLPATIANHQNITISTWV